MSRWIFDIETDKLLLGCTRMYILAAYNLDTKEMKYWLEGDLGWKDVFDKAELVVGHNILGFDVFVLKKLFGYNFPKTCSMHDTLIMSQILDYKRFGNDGHSLKRWGVHLGFPKHDFEDFSAYSEEMLEYCLQDVRLGTRVYHILVNEVVALAAKAPQIKDYLRAEHAVAKWCTEASLIGWPFNVDAAKQLYAVFEKKLRETHESLAHKLGIKCVPLDKKKGIFEWKEPKWTKQGFYDKHTADYFDIHPCSGFEGEERMVLGKYSRVEFVPLSLTSVADVKVFLFRNGWVPTMWNYAKDENGRRTKQKTTPKITEDSIEFLGGDGKLYIEFLSTKSRHDILKTWLENVDAAGNLHGDAMTVGTPSMRMTHSIIVNVPTADKPWGKEMRDLFRCKPGHKVIGCDSAGNQARGLAYYLGDEKFIYTLLHGDIHQYNADILTDILKDMGIDHVVKRAQAKRILYAFLFGAAGPKLWSYIFGVADEEKGKKLKNGFIKAVPGFRALLEKLQNIYGKTSQYSDEGGYIPGIAGNKIYVDSFHKLLVYLLQACEKATCSAALMLAVERMEAENIPYYPCIMMHDEIDFQVPEEYAVRAAEIGKQAFIDGPKIFGINIMDGDAKIGESWYDVH
jgi:DNA polymerase-1